MSQIARKKKMCRTAYTLYLHVACLHDRVRMSVDGRVRAEQSGAQNLDSRLSSNSVRVIKHDAFQKNKGLGKKLRNDSRLSRRCFAGLLVIKPMHQKHAPLPIRYISC